MRIIVLPIAPDKFSWIYIRDFIVIYILSKLSASELIQNF